MKTTTVGLIAAFLIVVTPAMAEPTHKQFMMIGLDVTCGAWVNNPVDHEAGSLWADGYVSGLATVNSDQNGPDVLRGLDGGAIKGWLDNYCRAHPLERFSQAALALWNHLYNDALIDAAPPTREQRAPAR